MRLMRICVFSLLCACVSVGCSSNGTLRKDEFREQKLSVYIRVDSIDFPETSTDEELNKVLIDKGLIRYRNLMTALGIETGKAEYIDGLLKKNPAYKIAYIHEYEYYTEAMIDFDIPPEVFTLYREKFPLPEKADNNDE